LPLSWICVVEHPRAGEDHGPGADQLRRRRVERGELRGGEGPPVAGERHVLLVGEVRRDDLAQRPGRGGGLASLAFPAGPAGCGGEAVQALPGDNQPVGEHAVLSLELSGRGRERRVALQQRRVDHGLFGGVMVVDGLLEAGVPGRETDQPVGVGWPRGRDEVGEPGRVDAHGPVLQVARPQVRPLIGAHAVLPAACLGGRR